MKMLLNILLIFFDKNRCKQQDVIDLMLHGTGKITASLLNFVYIYEPLNADINIDDNLYDIKKIVMR